jgi:apolipoprotein N-acyltransferase
VPALVVLTALMVGLPAAGRWRAEALARRPPAGRVRVAIAQGNVAQDHKWDPAYQDETMARYRGLTEAAGEARPELVVWPETATPFFFQQAGPLRDDVLELARTERTYLLFGSPAARRGEGEALEEMNRAYLVSPEGRELTTYDKIQLVPFGEYVPYRRVLFFVDQMVEAVGTMVPGVHPTVFELPAGRFGVLGASSRGAETSSSTSPTTPGTVPPRRPTSTWRRRRSAPSRTGCRSSAPPTPASRR